MQVYGRHNHPAAHGRGTGAPAGALGPAVMLGRGRGIPDRHLAAARQREHAIADGLAAVAVGGASVGAGTQREQRKQGGEKRTRHLESVVSMVEPT